MSYISILLIEDDAEHQQLLISAIESAGSARVIVGRTGGDCLHLIKTHEFDCIVLDYTLPDMSAAELIGRLEGQVRGVPIIVVSGREDQKIVIECFRRGGVDFIPKIDAVQGDILIRRIRLAIDVCQRQHAAVQGVERRMRRLSEESETDPLTGLCNRRFFDRLTKQKRHNDRRKPLGCLMLDIDHFKSINDQHGHPAGDAVLRGVADALRSHLAPGDLAIRWGGEEFLVLHACESLSQFWFWADDLRKSIQERRWHLDTSAVAVTVSAGIVRDEMRPLDEQSVHLADQALYLAKQTGRNRVCTWNMSKIDQALQSVESFEADHYARRRELFFDQCESGIGPAQRQQVTGHCWSVRQLSGAVARKMSLDGALVRRVEDAALLHDIGMVVVPEDVLAKPDALTATEKQMVNWRVTAGWQIAQRLGANVETTALVREYSEMKAREQDGTDDRPAHRSADPVRFRADAPETSESPLAPSSYKMTQVDNIATRILSASDALASMVANRPYRRARSNDEALAELQRCAGTQFDGHVIHAMSQVLSMAA